MTYTNEEYRYRVSDELQKLIDWEAIMPMKRYAGGHDEQMQALLKGSTVVAHYNSGGYQGKVATIVKLNGKYIAYNDFYGSCSACDAWEDASHEEVKKLCIDLANSAYIFDTKDDIERFFKDASEDATADYPDRKYIAPFGWDEEEMLSSLYAQLLEFMES